MTEYRKQMNQVIDKMKKDNARGLEELTANNENLKKQIIKL